MRRKNIISDVVLKRLFHIKKMSIPDVMVMDVKGVAILNIGNVGMIGYKPGLCIVLLAFLRSM